jgi:predicted SprT family Zn-dependent metalloprotease
MYKCSCGQPYNVEQEGDYPFKDEFTRDCPTCGKELKYKACCMSTDWKFDPDFKKQEA